MCGIVAGYSKRGQRIGKPLSRRYEDQKSRGQEGFGFVGLGLNELEYFRCTDESEFKKALKTTNSPFIVAHHRYPTSTLNVLECAHPILVKNDELDYDYFVVHNGVIQNCDDLKKKHETLGYEYNTMLETEERVEYKHKNGGKYYTASKKGAEYNDSESLAIELARCFDGMTREINTVGSVAFIAIQVSKETGLETKMFYGRNAGNPLVVEENREFIWIKSLGAHKIPEDTLFEVDLSNMTTTSRDLKIGFLTYAEKIRPAYNYNTHTLPAPKENEGKIKYDDYGWTDRYGVRHLYDDDPAFPSSKDYTDNDIGVGIKDNDESIYEKDDRGNYKSKMGFKLTNSTLMWEDVALENNEVFNLVKRVVELQDTIDATQFLLDEVNDKLESAEHYNNTVNTYADLVETDGLLQEKRSYEETITNSETYVEKCRDQFYEIDLGHKGMDFFDVVDLYKEKEMDKTLAEMIDKKSSEQSTIVF